MSSYLGSIDPAFLDPKYGVGTGSFGGSPLAGSAPGFNLGGGTTADYSGGAATNAFGGGGLSWGAVQGLGNLANMGIQAFGNQQGTKAGQDYLDFMADMRDATFGSDLFERNRYITDSFRIPLIVGSLRTNNPELRAETRTMNLGNLAGKYLDQPLGGFLST